MTQEQKTELEYLIDLLREASKWNVDQGDDALRLEVDLRINNILNSVEVEGETEVQGEPEVSPVLTQDDYRDLESAKLNEYLERATEKKKKQAVEAKTRWKVDRVRVQENGRPVWHLKTDCHKEIIPGFEKKWRWVWNGNKENNDAKEEQIEQMWNEHNSEGN